MIPKCGKIGLSNDALQEGKWRSGICCGGGGFIGTRSPLCLNGKRQRLTLSACSCKHIIQEIVRVGSRSFAP